MHATTSAFGLVESLRGQGSSLAKILKSFGKSLVKKQISEISGLLTPPEHQEDDIRLTWLTNRHRSKKAHFEHRKSRNSGDVGLSVARGRQRSCRVRFCC
ncbi:unnamed protein product [Caenorhabditis sp. 36 PRJEB53466]|nr:unnamed protein product [Caenorhabditis sp. 36 PRJEB53466]